MSQVRESDFFANVQNSALVSPHLTAIKTTAPPIEFELSIPDEPAAAIDSIEFPEPKPDIEKIDSLIRPHEKELFGRPDRGVIGRIIATRDTRIEGLAGILSNFVEYEDVSNLTKTQLHSRSHKLNETKEFKGKKVKLGELLGGAHQELMAVYVKKVEVNDPLVQVLDAIKNHRPSGTSPMSEEAYDQLVDDALVTFASDDFKKVLKQRLAELKTMQD